MLKLNAARESARYYLTFALALPYKLTRKRLGEFFANFFMKISLTVPPRFRPKATRRAHRIPELT